MFESDFDLEALIQFMANFVKVIVDWYARLFDFANDAQDLTYVKD